MRLKAHAKELEVQKNVSFKFLFEETKHSQKTNTNIVLIDNSVFQLSPTLGNTFFPIYIHNFLIVIAPRPLISRACYCLDAAVGLFGDEK